MDGSVGQEIGAATILILLNVHGCCTLRKDRWGWGSYKMDLDIWDCFERKINPSCNRRNTVYFQRKQLYHFCLLSR